jgi:hypothetical protein
MSKMNAKPSGPKSTIPKPPPLPGKSKTQLANSKLNKAETAGGHSRSRHVGMSDQQLKNRNIPVATSFKTAHDQNKTVAKVLGTSQMKNLATQAKGANQHQAMTISGSAGRTAPIARVAQNGQTFNAKVTETTLVLKKGSGKILTTYPSKFDPLPKPASGPNLKPPTINKKVTSIATGASQLRSVPKPVDKGPNLGDQKRFRGVTKNAKKK